MNEQLQAALAEMLGKANAGIDAGASFLQAQLPDVIQQLLMWKAAISIVTSLAAVALVVLWLVVFARLLHLAKAKEAAWAKSKDWLHQSDAYFPLGISALISGVFATIIASSLFSMDWLQIWIAPKIYLIEYAASLAK